MCTIFILNILRPKKNSIRMAIISRTVGSHGYSCYVDYLPTKTYIAVRTNCTDMTSRADNSHGNN